MTGTEKQIAYAESLKTQAKYFIQDAKKEAISKATNDQQIAAVEKNISIMIEMIDGMESAAKVIDALKGYSYSLSGMMNNHNDGIRWIMSGLKANR